MRATRLRVPAPSVALAALLLLLSVAFSRPTEAQAFERGVWTDREGSLLVLVVPLKYRYALSLIGLAEGSPRLSAYVEEAGGRLLAADPGGTWSLAREGAFLRLEREEGPGREGGKAWLLEALGDPARAAGFAVASDSGSRLRTAASEEAPVIAVFSQGEALRVAPGTGDGLEAWFEAETLAGGRGWTRGTFLPLAAYLAGF